MKWSPILHHVAMISGILGILSLFGAWIVRTYGTFLGLSQGDFYNDAITLLLVSIAFGVGTLIHRDQERK